MQTTRQNLLGLILSHSSTTAKELREQLGVSQVLIHRHLKSLCEEGKIQKIGSPPKVFYVPKSPISYSKENFPSSEVIAENWLEILPNGKFVYGEEGFYLWCQERKLNFSEQQKEYERIFLEKESVKHNGLIDATRKITTSFTTNFLEKVWYIDFYSWEIFGKTLLGKLVLYAKQNSDEQLMKSISKYIRKPLCDLLDTENFDLICIIPHSVPRKKDFLSTTLSFLSLQPRPEHLFSKVFAGHAVAQKTLKSKKEREQNAQETLMLNKKVLPSKILLIDDACGSGATLNIAAQKIKEVAPNAQVFAVAFVGSIKGFEVIADS